MSLKVIYIGLMGLLAFSFITGAICNGDCDKHGVLLYEEIGCKPLRDEPDDLCPSSYNCSHLDEEGEHCFFQGKKYKNREALDDDAVYESCNGGCFCDATYGLLPYSKFTCAEFDCPEFIGGSPLNSLDCLRTYKLDDCCASGQICPPFDNISTCKVDGRIYKEGQRFYPKSRCSKCVCRKGFNGKYEAPFCKRQNCAAELKHTEEIRQSCAPVYENYENEGIRCCPFLWICSSEADIFSPMEKNNKSAKTCKFGQRKIKSGQVLRKSVEQYGRRYEIKCNCQLPPLLTCIIESFEWIRN